MKWLIALLAGVAIIVFFAESTRTVPSVTFNNGQTIFVELAITPIDQQRGLSGHTPLGDQHGMLFVFTDKAVRQFWMKDMTFAIDIIWISDGQVVGIEKAAPPPSDPGAQLPMYFSPDGVDQVLEVSAGWSDRHAVHVGSRLTYK